MTQTTVIDLQEELDRAHRKLAIQYYHIGKVPPQQTLTAIEEMFRDHEYDVYIGVGKEYFGEQERIQKLRLHIRQKYGHFIRILVVEEHDDRK